MNDEAAGAGPFARAARLLEVLAGIRLAVKRVERAAEASGAAAAAAFRDRDASYRPVIDFGQAAPGLTALPGRGSALST